MNTNLLSYVMARAIPSWGIKIREEQVQLLESIPKRIPETCSLLYRNDGRLKACRKICESMRMS
jgi:hypothetical protein